jgi:hypothetical protein
MDPKSRTITVWEEEYADRGERPSGLAAYAHWLTTKLLELPEAHRSTARVEIEAGLDSENQPELSYRIVCERPETEEEIRLRQRQVERTKQLIARQEMAQLRRLLDKYPNVLLELAAEQEDKPKQPHE